eukprot:COSAG02_NODE_1714_length_11220_cov_3.198543_8_plen_97_part_00
MGSGTQTVRTIGVKHLLYTPRVCPCLAQLFDPRHDVSVDCNRQWTGPAMHRDGFTLPSHDHSGNDIWIVRKYSNHKPKRPQRHVQLRTRQRNPSGT